MLPRLDRHGGPGVRGTDSSGSQVLRGSLPGGEGAAGAGGVEVFRKELQRTIVIGGTEVEHEADGRVVRSGRMLRRGVWARRPGRAGGLTARVLVVDVECKFDAHPAEQRPAQIQSAIIAGSENIELCSNGDVKQKRKKYIIRERRMRPGVQRWANCPERNPRHVKLHSNRCG